MFSQVVILVKYALSCTARSRLMFTFLCCQSNKVSCWCQLQVCSCFPSTCTHRTPLSFSLLRSKTNRNKPLCFLTLSFCFTSFPSPYWPLFFSFSSTPLSPIHFRYSVLSFARFENVTFLKTTHLKKNKTKKKELKAERKATTTEAFGLV